MSDPLQDRVAVVTGGASGIGLAMAREVAKRAVEQRSLYVFTRAQQREILARRAAREDVVFQEGF
jgi:NAD(P)-dependent dehydrogenase (short-subunit alcohol dehydrogenase family)